MVIFHPIITEQEYINQDITMLKEYVVSFCIDRTQWTGNKEKDLNYFIFTITSLMIKNGDLILNKLAKYKYAFDINSYKHCVDICSKKMNDIVNEI